MKLDGSHQVSAITQTSTRIWTSTAACWGSGWSGHGLNGDDPGMRHIAYGDEAGLPGSIATFFDMPHTRRGRAGAGMRHRLLLRVATHDALDFWERGPDEAAVETTRTGGAVLRPRWDQARARYR